MRSHEYQIEVMSVVGYAIFQLQRVEHAISYCWMLHARRQNEPVDAFVFEGDFNELQTRNSKKMLGRFIIDIRSSGQFKASFRRKFERFVNDRNRLIHRIFKEREYRNLRNKRALERLHKFASNVLRDAVYFERVFDAYLGMSLELLATQPEHQFANIDTLKRLMIEKHRRGELNWLRSAIKKP
jgi:hypothetical protein